MMPPHQMVVIVVTVGGRLERMTERNMKEKIMEICMRKAIQGVILHVGKPTIEIGLFKNEFIFTQNTAHGVAVASGI